MAESFEFSYSVHVQRVYSEVVRVHVEVVKDFLECELLIAFFQDHSICFSLVCGLYESQQMLLVHASGSMYMCVHLCLTQVRQWHGVYWTTHSIPIKWYLFILRALKL